MTVEPDKLHLAALERLERRLENVLRDMRNYRHELEGASKDKGVLGSRSLTEFVLGLLEVNGEMHINVILSEAESTGYKIPTRRIMSKRLTERAWRVGDIQYDALHEKWVWKGKK